jgi:hypothetical protein
MSFVERCIPELSKLYTFEEDDVIIDPCARDGSLLSLLVLLSDFVVGYDIQPKNEHILAKHGHILKVDYLTLPVPIKPIDSRMFVIGNPPDKLRKEFIEKSCEFADIIAFLLPEDSKQFFSSKFKNIKCIPMDEGLFQIWERIV